MIVTALDEVAWLLNVRGGDNDFSPFLKSYVFISTSGQTVLFVDSRKVTQELRKHLNSDGCLIRHACVE